MFFKICLVLIVGLLAATLMNQRSQNAVHAQAAIEYKVVEVEIYVTDEKSAFKRGTKLYSTQEALDEYSKAGWELVTASYEIDNNNNRRGRLIFKRR